LKAAFKSDDRSRSRRVRAFVQELSCRGRRCTQAGRYSCGGPRGDADAAGKGESMRALFSLAGLLVVVVIVMLLAKKQLQAVVPSAPPAAAPSTTGAATVPEQSRNVQQKVLQDVGRALEQGAQRSSDSQP
jgi:hypothetical protein